MTQLQPNATKKRRITKSLSIDDALPGDVVMHILSFDSLYHPKSVCKQWKLHCDRNENNKMRQIYRKFINISPTSQTWIVHPKRRKLNEFEKNHGFKGPMNISDTINNVELKDGDNILIHDGAYIVKKTMFSDKNINLYGLGENVLIEALDIGTLLHCTVTAKKVIMEKLNITNNMLDETGISAVCSFPKSSTVTLKKCKFENCAGFSAVFYSDPSKLIIEDCSFINCEIAVWAVGAFCSVKNCLFKRCGNVPGANYYRHTITIGDRQSRLECIGNIFEDCLALPIAFKPTIRSTYHALNMNDHKDKYVVRDNILKGNKSNNKYDDITFDANTVYSNII